MPSVYSVGVGGGGPAWQRGLGNLRTILGALEARKQKRRREEAERQQEEAKRQREEQERSGAVGSNLAWTPGMPGMSPGMRMAIAPLMRTVASSAMRGALGQMPRGRAAPGMSGSQPPAAGGDRMALLMNLLRRNPQLGSLLAGPRGQRGALLPLLRALLGGMPTGIGRFGGRRRGGQPPSGPFKIAI